MTKYEDLPRDKAGDIIARDVEFPINYTLLEPLEASGSTRSDLDIHELRVGEIEAANKKRDAFEQTILLVANSARISPDEVRKMGSRDYAALSRTVAAFL